MFKGKIKLTNFYCRSGGIGRRRGFKIPRFFNHGGSSPPSGTIVEGSQGLLRFLRASTHLRHTFDSREARYFELR